MALASVRHRRAASLKESLDAVRAGGGASADTACAQAHEARRGARCSVGLSVLRPPGPRPARCGLGLGSGRGRAAAGEEEPGALPVPAPRTPPCGREPADLRRGDSRPTRLGCRSPASRNCGRWGRGGSASIAWAGAACCVSCRWRRLRLAPPTMPECKGERRSVFVRVSLFSLPSLNSTSTPTHSYIRFTFSIAQGQFLLPWK